MIIQKTVLYTFLKEFWLRLLYLILCLFLTFLTCFFHSVEIFYLTLYPVLNQNKKFFFIDLTEAFTTTFHLSFMMSVFFFIPFVFYQNWCFVVAGYYFRERKRLAASICFICVTFFIFTFVFYFFFLPEICHFFIAFEIKTPPVTVELETRINTYLALLFRFILLIIFFWIFLPLLFLGIGYNIISAENLFSFRGLFTFFSLLSTAFISPPTGVYQLVFFCILIFAYEFLILFGISRRHFQIKVAHHFYLKNK